MASVDTVRTGRETVAEELRRRGWTVREARVENRPMLMMEREGVRRATRVTARSTFTWQTKVTYGAEYAPDEVSRLLWTFVDLISSQPESYVVPESWMVEDIFRHHQAHLVPCV